MDTYELSAPQREALQFMYELVRERALMEWSSLQTSDTWGGLFRMRKCDIIITWNTVMDSRSGRNGYRVSLLLAKTGECHAQLERVASYNNYVFMAEYQFRDVREALVQLTTDHPGLLPEKAWTKEDFEERGLVAVSKEHLANLEEQVHQYQYAAMQTRRVAGELGGYYVR